MDGWVAPVEHPLFIDQTGLCDRWVTSTRCAEQGYSYMSRIVQERGEQAIVAAVALFPHAGLPINSI